MWVGENPQADGSYDGPAVVLHKPGATAQATPATGKVATAQPCISNAGLPLKDNSAMAG